MNSVWVAGTIAGVVLIYLGAANGIFAIHLETCTMGAADSLSGGVITLVLYAVGALLLVLSRPPRFAYLALLPAVLLIWPQVSFSVELARGVWLEGLAACAVVQGVEKFEFDGREAFFASLWLAVSGSILIGLAAGLLRKPRDVSRFRRSESPPAG
jgi:hypothetical protein